MIKNYETSVANIRNELKNYLENFKLKSLILGVSGGIDSALCAALARPVCDELGIPLICRSITIVSNKPDEIDRAKRIGIYFGTDFKEIDLSESFFALQKMMVENLETENKTEIPYKLRMGNLKARMRMIYLYELASKHKGMVLSTDNFTELLLGFWTLHGDVGDYGMIQQLWKTEVYEMSRFVASKLTDKNASQALLDCVNATPTDGLGITNSDLDQIGANSYEEVDLILRKVIYNTLEETLKTHPVVLRNRNSSFKRNNPFNIPREKITNEGF